MIRLVVLFCLMFVFTYSYASQPHFYSFNKVDLYQDKYSIHAKLVDEKELEYFKIITPYISISLESEVLNELKNPLLSTIQFSVMPYENGDELFYAHQVTMLFEGDKKCVSSTEEQWSPKSKLIVVFTGDIYKTHIDDGECDA